MEQHVEQQPAGYESYPAARAAHRQGAFAFESYHANADDVGRGLRGTVRESMAATLGFRARRSPSCGRVRRGRGGAAPGTRSPRRLPATPWTSEHGCTQYGFISARFWGFTLDDGLRRLVETFARSFPPPAEGGIPHACPSAH